MSMTVILCYTSSFPISRYAVKKLDFLNIFIVCFKHWLAGGKRTLVSGRKGVFD